MNLLPRGALREFTAVHTSKWLAAAAIEWTIILGTMTVCAVVGGWLICIPAVLIIGSRQHALGVLAHEGAHHLVSRNKKVNDGLSDLLAAYPIGFTTVGFRTTHLRHHAFLETEKDPSRVTIDLWPEDWTFPMSKRHVAKVMLRDLSGLSQAASSVLLKYLWEIPGGRGRHLAQLLAFHAVAIGATLTFGIFWMYLALWVLPLFTVAIAFYRIRAVAEHSGLDTHQIRYLDDSADPLSATRTTIPQSALSKFVFAPYNISYHIEHHLYPAVPVFDLPRLHSVLLENPEYEKRAHLTKGHSGLLEELTA